MSTARGERPRPLMRHSSQASTSARCTGSRSRTRTPTSPEACGPPGVSPLYASTVPAEDEMLRLARLHHTPYETGMALLGLAQSRTYGGDAPAGLTFAEEQFRVAQQLRNPSMLALALYDQAE